MYDERALAILTALADGVNPVTGEVFAQDSAYQQAEVVRALYVAVTHVTHAIQAASRGRKPNAPNAGKPWNENEDFDLLTQFDRGVALTDIATGLGRTVVGIEARLEKHQRRPVHHTATKVRS